MFSGDRRADVDDGGAFVRVEGGDLGGGAEGNETGGAVGEDLMGERGERVAVDAVFGGERGDEGDEDSGEFHGDDTGARPGPGTSSRCYMDSLAIGAAGVECADDILGFRTLLSEECRELLVQARTQR